MTVYLGIDPGKDGAIGAITERGPGVITIPKTDVDTYRLLEATCDLYQFDIVIVLERILMSPEMSKWKGIQKLVGNFHLLRGFLIALGVSFEALTPRQWRGELGLAGVDKHTLFARAQEIFPNVKITKSNADAMLMAEVCRRRNVGEGKLKYAGRKETTPF